MVIYLVMFTISLLLFRLYEICKYKNMKQILLIVAIFLPCILAGLRAVSVGTDTRGYISTLYDTASSSSSIISYYQSTFYYEWHNTPVASFDFAYTLLTYLCATAFRSFGVFLFFSEVLIIAPIVAAINLLKKHFDISVTLSMLLFYLMYYNTTYNAVRQWLAIAFAFLAVAHLCTDKNKKKIFSFGLIACLFHKSGLLVVVLIVFYLLVNGVKGIRVRIGSIVIKKDTARIIEIILLSFLLLMSMSYIITPLLAGIGLGRYTGYINGQIIFSINQIIYQIPFVVVLIIERKIISINDTDTIAKKKYKLFNTCLFFINMVLSQLASVNENSWRVTLIFGLFNTVLFSYIYANEKNKTKKNICLLILFVYAIFYWYFIYVLTGRHGTVPYVFT